MEYLSSRNLFLPFLADFLHLGPEPDQLVHVVGDGGGGEVDDAAGRHPVLAHPHALHLSSQLRGAGELLTIGVE